MPHYNICHANVEEQLHVTLFRIYVADSTISNQNVIRLGGLIQFGRKGCHWSVNII